VVLPSSSLAEEDKKIEGISEPVVLPSSSLAEEDKKIEGISEPVVLPSSSLAEEDKKIEGLSDKGPVSGSVPLEESKGSETETGDQMVAFQAGLIVTGDTVSEHVDLPSSSLGTEEEDMEGLPEKGPISSSVPLEESNCPKAEMGDRIDASQAGGILPQDVSEDIDLPSSSMVAEKNIEDSSDMGPVGSSITLEESKVSEAEIVDQMTVSRVCGTVPGNALENMDLPQCSSATEGENIEGLSEKDPVGSSVAMEESNN